MRNIVNIFYNFLVVIYHCFNSGSIVADAQIQIQIQIRVRVMASATDTDTRSSCIHDCWLWQQFAAFSPSPFNFNALRIGPPLALELSQLPLWKRQQTIFDLWPAIRNAFNSEPQGHNPSWDPAGYSVLSGAQLQAVGSSAKTFCRTISDPRPINESSAQSQNPFRRSATHPKKCRRKCARNKLELCFYFHFHGFSFLG